MNSNENGGIYKDPIFFSQIRYKNRKISYFDRAVSLGLNHKVICGQILFLQIRIYTALRLFGKFEEIICEKARSCMRKWNAQSRMLSFPPMWVSSKSFALFKPITLFFITLYHFSRKGAASWCFCLKSLK